VAEITREALLESLRRQRMQFSSSIVLTPVDSLPFVLADREHTAFLHGLYLTDKVRDRQTAIETVIQFAGREVAARDLAAIHRLLADALNASEGSLRLLAGLQAHTVVFMSIATIGQKVMLLPEEAGGHFSTKTILRRLGLHTVDMPIDRSRLCIDPVATLDALERERPDFVFVDRSEGLRYEDFSFIGRLKGPVKVFDASQCLIPILSQRYENPLDWGFDLMLFTLHKSFPGPQKAGIVGRGQGELWQRLISGLSSFVSSSHAENSYLFGLALLREDWLRRYEQRLFDSALALEEHLADRGIDLVARSEQGCANWPSTHHIWLKAGSSEGAYRMYEDLAEIGILTNYRRLPYGIGYGLRLGTTHSAVAGLDVEHAAELAEIIRRRLKEGPSPDLRERVAALAQTAARGAIVPTRHWA
jgi:glycine/serine hydroxymethyltransferase